VRFIHVLVVLICSLARVISGSQPDPTWHDSSPHRAQMVTVDRDVTLEILDWGGTGRSVLLLGGSGLSAHIFDDFAPKLSAYAHVYGVTRRGFGRSSQPQDGYSNQRLADDIVAVIDRLAVDHPILIGHSMAGGEMTTVASQHSDRLGGVVYIDALRDPRDPDDPGLDPKHTALLEKMPAPTAAPISDVESKSFDGYRAWQLRSMRFSFPQSELRTVFATNDDGSMGRHRTPGRVFKAIGDGEIKRDYSRINVPVLAFIDYPRWESDAWRYDRKLYRPGELVPDNQAQREAMAGFSALIGRSVDRSVAALKRGVPDARIVDLPGAGHYMFLTREWDVVAEIAQFVAVN
jgi:non-heme chloroperoxidase